jgi:DNA-binding SARP family transcriptional activator/Tfp pilus assembly protein PilF
MPEGAATRPRSLALLAILAAAGEAGVSRDKLLLYLWPESNTRRARNSLYQTLFAIRQHLGEEAVQAGTTNLQLNPACFTCDLWDFASALGRDAVEEAIGLYDGPFLDGFALPDLPELDRWMEEERIRIAHRYADALEAAAARAGEQGHHRRAVERWQALARLAPLSSRPALGLIRAFAAAGNRASALEHARDYQALIRRELGTDPDPAIGALAEQLRRSDGRAGEQLTVLDRVAPKSQRLLPTGLWRAALAVLVLVDIGALAALWWTHRGPRAPTTADRVAVFPFTVEGSVEAQYLSTGLVDLLSSNLEGAGETRSVDPRALLGRLAQREAPVRSPAEAREVAAGFGAGRYLLGNVVESGGRLHLRAALYDSERGDEPLGVAVVQGEASALFGMVDQLTAELLAQGRPAPRERLARVAATTTGSLEALKRYLAGERELRAGRYAAAQEAFRGAIALDSSFALAYYRLSITAEWLGQDSLARIAADSAARIDGRLSDHDRLLVHALRARRVGALSDAEQLYRKVVDDYPDDVEAWLQLGQLLFQSNPLRGRSATEARSAFERVLALDPEDEEALVHLARIASIEGRRGQMDTLVQRVLALGSATEVLETRAFRAFALGDRDAWKRVTRELIQDPPDVPPVTALQVATYLDDLDGAERFARLLSAPRYSDDVRGMAYRLLARVAVARGQWSVARVQLDTAGRFDATAALELRSLLAVLPFLRVPREELLAIRLEVESWQARVEAPGEVSHSTGHAGLHPYVRRYRLGLLSAQLGDTIEALRQAGELERASASASGMRADAIHTFAHSIRARVAVQAGRSTEALGHLQQSNWEMVESVFESEALDRYYRAELLDALGRHTEALDWYRTIAERATYELVYVAPARWRQGRLYEQAGDRPRAIEAYRTVTRLWREADPPLRAIVAEANQRLRALAGGQVSP